MELIDFDSQVESLKEVTEKSNFYQNPIYSSIIPFLLYFIVEDRLNKLGIYLNKIAFISELNWHIQEAVRDQLKIFDKLRTKFFKIIKIRNPDYLQEIERKIMTFYWGLLNSHEFSEAIRIITIYQDESSLDEGSSCFCTLDGIKRS